MPGTGTGRREGVAIRAGAVRQARLEAGLSLADVAGKEVSRTTIHLIETGRMRPSRQSLELIASRTRRPLSFFLDGDALSDEQRAARHEIERLVESLQFEPAVGLGLPLLEEVLPSHVEADIRLLVSRAYVRMRDPRQAEPHSARARELYLEVGDREKAVEALMHQISALNIIGDRRALPMSLAMLDECDRLPGPPRALLVVALISAGQVFGQHRQWDKAIAAFERALTYAPGHPNIRHLAQLHESLGIAYGETRDRAASQQHAAEALRLYQEAGDPIDLIRAEHNTGELLLHWGDLEAAERHFREAISLADRRGLEHVQPVTLASLGELNLGRGDLGQAEAWLTAALKSASLFGVTTEVGNAQCLFGRLAIARDDLDAAVSSYTAALTAFEAAGLYDRIRDCHTDLADALHQAGRLDESIVHWRAAVEAMRTGAAAAAELPATGTGTA